MERALKSEPDFIPLQQITVLTECIILTNLFLLSEKKQKQNKKHKKLLHMYVMVFSHVVHVCCHSQELLKPKLKV